MYSSLEELLGCHTVARDGELGRIRDLYFDDLRWRLRYLVIDTGGWLRDHRVLVSPEAILGVAYDQREVSLDLSRAEIENSPPADREPPATEQRPPLEGSHFTRYWLMPMHVGLPVGPAGLGLPTVASNVATPHSANPHLRSVDAVLGYALSATDGKLGSVDDLLVDTHDWEIRYLVADTRRWLPSRSVLLDVDDLDGVDDLHSQVIVSLTRDEIRHAPEYRPPGGSASGDDGELPELQPPSFWI